MESDGGSGGVAATAVAPQAIPSHYSTLGEFFLASDFADSVNNVDNNSYNNNNDDNVISNNDNDNINNLRPISRLTLGDVLDVNKKKVEKPAHKNPFFRSRLTPNNNFFRNSRPILSKLSLNDKKSPPPPNNLFFHNPQPGLTLGDVLSGDKKPSSSNNPFFRNPRSISKITLDNVFNHDKRPSQPPINPQQPISTLTLGVVFDKDKKPPPPPPPPNKSSIRSLIANIRNIETLKVRSVFKKSWKTSKFHLKQHHDDSLDSTSSLNQYQNRNRIQNEDMNTEYKSFKDSIRSDSSLRWSDTIMTRSDHEGLALEEVDGEGSLKSSNSFKLPMEVVLKKEKTQRKFSRELFVLWCLFVGCISFFLFSFFRLS